MNDHSVPEENPYYGLEYLKFTCKIEFQLFTGVPPRNEATSVSSVPEKVTQGYQLTEKGPVKIQNPPQNRPIGPTTYYNPKVKNYIFLKVQKHSMTRYYRFNSQLSSQRF